MPEVAVVAAAPDTGEIDWWEVAAIDLLPSLAKDPKLVVETNKVSTAIGIARFNHLHPPFDNPAVRARPCSGAVDQAVAMQASSPGSIRLTDALPASEFSAQDRHW